MDWKYILTSFDGRINRAKFWAAIGVMLAIAIVLSIIDGLLGLTMGTSGLGVLSGIWSLISIYVGIAVYAKRWHDRDKSGWWTLIVLVPFIGGIWLLVECGFLPGTPGPNRYGPDPLA
jgi:uncharacterized membrane protein YhaH (DUF805 family)